MAKEASVSVLRVDHARASEPLRDCVRHALERYFSHLDGHEPNGLYDLVIGEVEAPLIEMVMRWSGHNQTRAAALLGINRGTLRKKLKQYRLG
jgi:Fis family transcriptional regulator, factor for inversion stimulation protein